MDTADYIALDQYLRGMHDIPQEKPTPILLVNDVPMQPGWSTVLVAWQVNGGTPPEEEQCHVGIFGYCPHSGWKYTTEGRANPGGWKPDFHTDIIPEISVWTGEGAYVAAQVEFANKLLFHQSGNADNLGFNLAYQDAELQVGDTRTCPDPPPIPLPVHSTVIPQEDSLASA